MLGQNCHFCHGKTTTAPDKKSNQSVRLNVRLHMYNVHITGMLNVQSTHQIAVSVSKECLNIVLCLVPRIQCPMSTFGAFPFFYIRPYKSVTTYKSQHCEIGNVKLTHHGLEQYRETKIGLNSHSSLQLISLYRDFMCLFYM